ncbi:ATP-binding protein [Candidatus Coxiella mudrowiae]|uniref:ATP-binding protein n=1 Tax=Candidatus Coxiella mudrowiae TaxID=2054173 RepID=UPI003144EF0B
MLFDVLKTLPFVSRRHHNRVNIYIEDDGPGIAEKELEQVFESFYRGELPFT